MRKFPPFRILAATLLVTLAARAQQNTGELDVAVRSGIDDAEKSRRDHDHAYAQDPTKRVRLFQLASVMQHPSAERLVNPVDATAIAKELKRLLEARGFHPVQNDQKPEIVITVEYGRGWLSNPYSNIDQAKTFNNLSDSDVLQAWYVHRLSFSFLEAKRAWTDQEKLIIQVRAWKYPPPADPKKNPVMLWMTTMHVDDPDHRDLNEIYPKMLANGAPYFDRHIDRESEVVVSIPMLPEGHVKVGSPEVVKDPQAK